MPRTTIAVLGSVGLILGSFTLGSCADATPPTEPAAETEMTAPGDVTAQFAGTWELVGIERHGADGELLPSDSEDRVGYIMYDPAGYMGVVIQRGSRQAYADVRPTSEEAREALRTYTSYFGTFTVDAAKGVVTHHLRGSLNPSGAGSDYERAFEMSGNRITLQPPTGPSGVQSRLTWQRVPDLAELTPEHQRFIGFWEIASVERRTESGETLPASQYAEGFILYTTSGHMAVHLMRPGRHPYADTQPTPEEALAAMGSYTSYFGPVSLHAAEEYIVHHRIGHSSPSAIGSDAQRFYELTRDQLILKPPATMVDGERVQSFITWHRLSESVPGSI